MGGDRFPHCDTPVRLGARVVVIGAGNTAMDCLRVAKRLGAPQVTCVYRRSEAEAPARREELRHAKEEGVELLFLHSPVEILTDTAGDVTGMKVERMELGDPDERGRRRPIPTGERFDLSCDTVIVALGARAKRVVSESADVRLCPKCHQPLEDDEEVYLCCAGAQLAWRCDSCGKVSEGFAFPYGMCPACDGPLAVLGQRRVETPAGLEAIRVAFEIELGGLAFYRDAAQAAQEPMLKKLFERFAAMETEHMATLKRRYHAELPDTAERLDLERAAIYFGIDGRPEDPVSLFRIAIAFEERAARFFAERGGEAPADSPQSQLYRELAAEEREHVEQLKLELERYRQGKPGLL